MPLPVLVLLAVQPNKRRRSGPGKSYLQEFLVRGTFYEDASDEEDEDEEEGEAIPVPNTFWVASEKLLETVERTAVKKALKDRMDCVWKEL